MYCSQCGEQIDDGSRFCRHCGARQDSAGSTGDDQSPSQTWEAPPVGISSQKPASSTGRTLGIAAAALLGLLVIGSIAGGSKSPEAAAAENSADALADKLEAQADNLEAMADAAEKPKPDSDSRWSYSTDVDKVRGGTSYFATMTSSNTIRQDPPYDSDTSMQMTVRRMPSSGTDVVLSISSGQFMCPSYQGCSGTVRFDNGAPQRVSFNGPADNSSDTIFVVGAKGFVSKLKKAKKVIVEKTLYQAGEPQFEFDVSGLKWDH